MDVPEATGDRVAVGQEAFGLAGHPLDLVFEQLDHFGFGVGEVDVVVTVEAREDLLDDLDRDSGFDQPADLDEVRSASSPMLMWPTSCP
ncbi:hypothetical protein [Glycomyces tarimensis]